MSHWAIRVTRGAGFSVVAEILARAANTIFFILLTWYSSEADPGRYALGFVFSLLLLPFAFGGFEQLLMREAARDRSLAPRLLGNLLLGRAVGAVLCYIGLLTWLSFDQSYDAQTILVIALLAATCVPESLINLYQSYLFAFERVEYITLIGAITGILKLMVGLVVLMQGHGASGAAMVVLAASITSLVLHATIVSWRIGPPCWRLDRELWRIYFRPASVFFVIAIATTVEGTQDSLLLSRLYGPAIVGVYAAATGLISILNILPQGFRQAVLPVLTDVYTNARDKTIPIVAQSLNLILTLTLLISLTLTLAIDDILSILYHGRFATAGPVFVTLVWAFVLMCCAIPNARLIVVAGKQDVYVPIHIISMLLNLGLNLWLQPWLNVQGAALARLASASLICGFGIIYVQMRIQRWPVVHIIVRPLAAAGTALIIMISLRMLHVPLWLTLPVGWGIYGGMIWQLRVFSAENVRWMHQLMRRRVVTDVV